MFKKFLALPGGLTKPCFSSLLARPLLDVALRLKVVVYFESQGK